MTLIAACGRHILRLQRPQALRQRPWKTSQVAHKIPRRFNYDGNQNLVVDEVVADLGRVGDVKQYINEFKTSFTVPKPNFVFEKSIPLHQIGQSVTAVGFVGKRRDIGRTLTFAPLSGGAGLEQVQLIARSEVNDRARKELRGIPENSAVSVTGILNWKYEEKSQRKEPETDVWEEGHCGIIEVEIRVQRIDCLTTFPKELKHQPNQHFDLRSRHLQIRFDNELRRSLEFRSRVAAFARSELSDFQEIETPILFKSTPEGAREFIVPARRKGFAYGLPQSPQQYKQILMASGIYRYVQFAKCFRDEDHRTDRQPEFTQIDLEMAWADGEDVMQRVEHFMKALWRKFAKPGTTIASPLPDTLFPRMTYVEAMSKHGSDKPDLRIKGLIHRVDHLVPGDLRAMLTSLKRPALEACKIRLDGDTAAVQKFIRKFMDSADGKVFRDNKDGAPGVMVVDLRRPLEGLQAFGFEGAEIFKKFYAEVDRSEGQFEEGDLILLQARRDKAYSGGSTMLGKLRLAVHKAAIEQGLLKHDTSHQFLWVTDFPMFTANNRSEPGQEGQAGFSATHHPFTAPKTAADVDLLLTHPLKAIADHYDLVLNGVELGGGSRRIHNAEMQKFVMREVLKMDAHRMTDFNHLFQALRAGCPPHAGFAVGFDRLIAVMQGRESVRDVIAFPKDHLGRDLMASAPTRVSESRLADYYLNIKDDEFHIEQRKAREVEAQKLETLEKLKVLLETITSLNGATPVPQPQTTHEPIVRSIATDEQNYEETNEQNEEPTVRLEGLDEMVEATGEGLSPAVIPRYRPGQLLPYVVTLYNQIGGKFLLESLKGFEVLIESLGEDIRNGTVEDLSKTDHDLIVQRLMLAHSELVQELLHNLKSIEDMHKNADPATSKEELQADLRECLEPARLLYSSLKTLEPMLENLTIDLEKSFEAIHNEGSHLGGRVLPDRDQESTQGADESLEVLEPPKRD